MSALFELLRRLAAVPDERCSAAWEWPGHQGGALQVRNALYLALEGEQAAAATSPALPLEAARIVGLGQAAFGDLRGLLAGCTDQDLDLVPAAGGWSLRELLAHVLEVERRYLFHTERAVGRGDHEALYIDPPISLADADRAGGLTDWVDRLATARSASAQLASTPDGALDRPTMWAGYATDVRFRLHRFAAHLAEHTVQAERTLDALGRRPAEAARIVRRISAVRGSHELTSDPGGLARLDAALAERASEIAP